MLRSCWNGAAKSLLMVVVVLCCNVAATVASPFLLLPLLACSVHLPPPGQAAGFFSPASKHSQHAGVKGSKLLPGEESTTCKDVLTLLMRCAQSCGSIFMTSPTDTVKIVNGVVINYARCLAGKAIGSQKASSGLPNLFPQQ